MNEHQLRTLLAAIFIHAFPERSISDALELAQQLIEAERKIFPVPPIPISALAKSILEKS